MRSTCSNNNALADSASLSCCCALLITTSGALSTKALLLKRPDTPAMSFSAFSSSLFKRAISALASINEPSGIITGYCNSFVFG